MAKQKTSRPDTHRPWLGRKEPNAWRPIECYRGRWLELVESVGTAQDLATVLGVSVRNLRRWAKGEIEPSHLVKLQLNLICSARGIGPIYRDP